MHNIKNTVWAGQPLAQAKRVLIMTHGRGASAQSILSLAAELEVEDFGLEDIEYEVSAEDAEAYVEDEAIITGDEEGAEG